LLQTGKRDMVPVVLLDAPGGSYWEKLHEFIADQLLGEGMICEEDLSLYKVTDSHEAAMEEVLGFYRVYHSMRYVKHHLVLRLKHALDESRVEAINDLFRDVLVDGRFEQRGAFSDERDEPDLSELPRLAFHFNRRNLGRLRQLIDWINISSPAAGE
jgi:hypothetical protein